MAEQNEVEVQKDTSSEIHQSYATDAGTAVITSDAVKNPGLPAHRLRRTDVDPKAAKRASRQVGIIFLLSMIGSVFAIVAYIVWPIHIGNTQSVLLNNLLVGLGIALGLLGIGIGVIHWARQLMVDTELVDERHPIRSSDETRAEVGEMMRVTNEESGMGRRTLLRNSLIGAAVLSPLPAVVMFRDLAPAADPHELMRHTAWKKGSYLTLDPDGVTRIKASDVTLGSAFHVIPEGLNELPEFLNEKAKAIVLLMRLKPEELKEMPERTGWSYNGIVAYSKVCTHVGCPVALYEQRTHHLLCPCHQSEFDVTNHCEVIFGPAKRPLPQLPIAVDADGYLYAQSDFHEPVGPSFWERVNV
ncbi:MAG: Rieske 2Fe-2S domain-containing protein [Microbacteriaceae bacterium]